MPKAKVIIWGTVMPENRSQDKGESQDKGKQNDQSRDRSQSQSGSEEPPLEEREYRDKEGNVHHHTKTYIEQHGQGGEAGGDGESSGRQRGSEGGSEDSRRGGHE
jgi:hypothetical protein